jgi:uncharacterized protein YndB with AHSA1/START domain
MPAISHELQVNAKPDTAYRAVATEAGIKQWWAKNCDVGEAVGSMVELRFTKPGMSAVMNFEVTGFEPGRKLEWTCRQNSNPIWPGSKLVWEIESMADGSVVRFSHDGFSGGGEPYDMTIAGWQLYMDSLKAYLDGRPAAPSD